MTYLFVGAGQAGSAIVDSIFEHTSGSFLGLFDSPDISTIGQPIVFNSTIRDLQNLSNVPPEAQFGVSEHHGLIQGTAPGFEEKVTGGFGRNPVEADQVMDTHSGEVRNILTDWYGPPSGGSPTAAVETDGGNVLGEPEADVDEEPDESTHQIDETAQAQTREHTGSEETPQAQSREHTGGADLQFAFLFLGLGGGTGCGIAPHLAREIKAYTDGRTQVIAFAVLPNLGGDGGDGGAGRQAWNARYGLNRLEETVDGIVLVDNQRISYLNSAGGEFGEYNEYVAGAVHDIIAGPVLSSVDASQIEGFDTPDIDIRDILTSLQFGVGEETYETGYAAIGRSVTMTKSLAGYLLPVVGKRDVDSAALARLAASKQTLADADVTDSEKAIVLIRSPKSSLSGGVNGVEPGTIKEFFERSCGLGEVNVGVALSDRNLISVSALLTYRRENISRLEEIEAKAEEYETETREVVQ